MTRELEVEGKDRVTAPKTVTGVEKDCPRGLGSRPKKTATPRRGAFHKKLEVGRFEGGHEEVAKGGGANETSRGGKFSKEIPTGKPSLHLLRKKKKTEGRSQGVLATTSGLAQKLLRARRRKAIGRRQQEKKKNRKDKNPVHRGVFEK